MQRFLSSLAGIALAAAALDASSQATGPLTNPNPTMAPQVNPQGHDAAPTAGGNAPIAPRQQPMPPSVAGGNAATAAAGDNRVLFARLDRAHRGYLNKSDVSSNQYLSRHFKQCDADGDGRLSQQEVNECLAHESPQSN